MRYGLNSQLHIIYKLYCSCMVPLTNLFFLDPPLIQKKHASPLPMTTSFHICNKVNIGNYGYTFSKKTYVVTHDADMVHLPTGFQIPSVQIVLHRHQLFYCLSSFQFLLFWSREDWLNVANKSGVEISGLLEVLFLLVWATDMALLKWEPLEITPWLDMVITITKPWLLVARFR